MNIKPSPYYFCYGEIGIISDAPGGPEAMKQFPEMEAKTLAEWENLSRLDFLNRKSEILSEIGFSAAFLNN